MRGRGAALVLCVCLGCGCGDDERPGGRDSGPVIPPAQIDPLVAFEGHRRMAVSITADGVDLTDATVAPDDPSGSLTVVAQRCNRVRCGALLAVADTRGNLGMPIPAPIDARNELLRIDAPSGPRRALLSVMPLDAITNGGSTPLMVRGTVMASSANATAGSTFRGTVGDPVRWVIFGGGALHGTVDVSAEGAEARAGGAPGGAAGLDGAGGGAGRAGLGGGGGGGAGAAELGTAGLGADGSIDGGGAGGAAAGDPPLSCLGRFDGAPCGGSGGGGATGSGGAGGGGLLIVALEPMDFGGGRLLVRGGDGADGGGGGSGGDLLLAAPSLTAPDTLEVGGGLGGPGAAGPGAGGEGSRGRLRADLGTGNLAAAWTGPSVDLAGLEQLTSAGVMTLRGRASADAAIEVAAIGGGLARTTTADAAGAWSVDVDLVPGLNRLAVTATGAEGTTRTWTGTNIELARASPGASPLPVGATVDVVFVPDSE